MEGAIILIRGLDRYYVLESTLGIFLGCYVGSDAQLG